jgi:hypothetical protein
MLSTILRSRICCSLQMFSADSLVKKIDGSTGFQTTAADYHNGG